MQFPDFLTDALLVQFFAEHSQAHEIAKFFHTKIQETFFTESSLETVAISDNGNTYAYIKLLSPQVINTEHLHQLQQSTNETYPASTISRLEKIMHLQNNFSKPPQAHYVVEMDPEEGWRDELFDWYDTEHLPGLASVSGTQQAWRYLNHDSGPLSLACYNLHTPDVLGCTEWLKVRATPWSDRVRPHFTNTKRTMFKLL